LSRRLFASAFLVPFTDGPEEASSSYDEARSLNLGPDGRPFVEFVATGATGTITEVRSEASDRDEMEGNSAATVGTVTKVRRESPDRLPALATQTRVRRERADQLDSSNGAITGRRQSSGALLGTKTGVRGESADLVCDYELRNEAPDRPSP